jgi:hypothetical protein
MSIEMGGTEMQTIVVKFTPELVSRATTCFWRRYLGIDGAVAFTLAWVLAIGLWALGSRAWYTTAFDTIVVLATFVFAGMYVVYRQRALNNLARIEDGRVEFQFAEDTLTVRSSLGNSRVRWEAFQRLWKFRDVWLLFVAKWQYVTLPVRELPPAVLALVELKVAGKRSVGT